MMTDISSCINVLAKKDETLESHTKNALNFLLRFFSWQEKTIEKIGEMENIPTEEIKSRLFIAVYLHDIGKATPEFQEHVYGKRKSCTPHALLSIPFALAACGPLNGIRQEALAIMSHHTPFYNRLYRTWREKKIDGKQYLPCAIDFYEVLPLEHQKMMGYHYPFKLEKEPRFGQVGKILNEAQNGLDFFPPQTIHDTFSLFVTALRYSDWLASGNVKDYSYSTTQIGEKMEIIRSKKRWEWENFQKKAANTLGDVFIRIPTGKGKTEAALLWANKNLNGGKLLYLLPTRVTTNAMFSRLLQAYKFRRSDVGISHGTSPLIVAEKEKWEERGWSTHLFSSAFMTPITVATVDQLLLTLFNWYHWELIESMRSFPQ